MYLTAEEKAIGKENFSAAIGSDTGDSRGVNRRDFLKRAIAAGITGSGSLGALCFGYDKSIRETLRVGLIGTGDQGGVLIGAINPNYLAVAAISEIRPYNIHRAFHGDAASDLVLKARPGLLAKYGWKTEGEARRNVSVYADYQELLRDERIEAVMIALPLHLHAPVAIAAMRAGKHVLVEKLMARTVRDCKEMARVAQQTGRCLAIGYQRYYNLLYDQARDLLKQGLLGDVHHVRAQWHRGNLPGRDSWQPPLPPGVKPADPLNSMLLRQRDAYRRELSRAQGASVDLWQKRVAQIEAQIADAAVNAQKHGYLGRQIKDALGQVVYDCPPIEELIRWRLWDHTGAGMMSELGSHQLSAVDILLSSFLEASQRHPLQASGWSSRSLFSVDREVEDHVSNVIAFPSPGYDSRDLQGRRKTIGLQYSAINGNGFGGYGEIVFGTKGTLVVERETEAMLFRVGDTASKIRVAVRDGKALLVTEAGGDPVSAAVGNMATVEVSRGYKEELEHWASCIRNPAPENQPRCHPRVGLANAVVALVSGMAARRGQAISFRKEWFDPASDETPEDALPDKT